MKILVTGSAGFIGSALSIKLLNLGFSVVGIDNHNDYYDPSLKERRLDRFLNNQNYGVVTSESGYFDLKLSKTTKSDSLIISYLGYHKKSIFFKRFF